MILGFAHLTYTTNRVDHIVECLQREGLLLTEIHRMAPSAAAKWPLMARPARTHDLALLKGALPLEIVGHDTGTVESPTTLGCDLRSKVINLRGRDAFVEREFLLRAFPSEAKDDSIEIRGAFPGWNACLRVIEDPAAPLAPPLDVEGFSCVAFYSNNPIEDCNRLTALGGRQATEEFGITLARRDLSVVMLRTPGGTIVELLGVKRR